MSLLPGGPAVGFDSPFEMLEACHERVERSLDLLLRLAEHLRHRVTDQQARDAARDLLRYFDLAAPLHHQDEELHVLPRLCSQGRHELAQRIADEHVLLHEAYQRIRPGLVALLEKGVRPDDSEWAAMAGMYRRHIALEEEQAYPVAQAGTDAEALGLMGREMASRRKA